MACKQLKIGIFFDGTGNSKEEYEEYSNIAKLSNLYRVLNDAKDISVVHQYSKDSTYTHKKKNIDLTKKEFLKDV